MAKRPRIVDLAMGPADSSWDVPRNFAELQELRTTGSIQREPTSPSVVTGQQLTDAFRMWVQAKACMEVYDFADWVAEELTRRNQDIADLQLTNRNLSKKIAYEIARSNGKH